MKAEIILTVFILREVFSNDYLFENNVSLVEIDKQIIKGIMEPEADKADELLKYVFEYHDALESIARMLELDYKPERNIKLLTEIQDFGGPHFIKMKFDFDKLNEVYQWDREDLIRFKAAKSAVKDMWFSLEHHLTKLGITPETLKEYR